MALAFTGFSLWAFNDFFKRTLRAYPVDHIAFLSMTMAVVLLLLLSPWLGGLRQTFTMPKLKLRIMRGVVLAIPTFLSYIVFANLDLATAYSIIFAAPILAKILSVFLLGEDIRMRSWLISALGFVGVLIVLRPGMVPLNVGTVSAIFLATFFALGYLMGRVIGPENQTLVSLSLFQFFIVAVGAAFTAVPTFAPLPLYVYVMCFAIGAISVVGSLIVSSAFAHAPSAQIAPIHYSQMVWGIILGAAFFGEYPDIWTLVGGGLVVLAGLLLIFCTRSYQD